MNPKQLFVFIGPPGSGKGSLSSMCVEKLGWVQLSTGDLCRKNIAEQTPIGQQIDFAIKSGKLVPDSLITEMVVQWFEQQTEHPASIILDGYPRTVAQAQEFTLILKSRLAAFDLKVVRFAISDEHVVARLSGRYICNNKGCQAVYSLIPGSSLAPRRVMTCDRCDGQLMRRSDDYEDAIRTRLKVYHQHEHDLISFFEQKGYAIEKCDVEKPLLDVFKEFQQLVGLRAA